MNRKAWRLSASLAFACGAFVASQASAAITVSVLSSMPQMVTGEDALVQIAGATAAPTVTVGGKDVSAVFKKDAKGNYVGLVTGLAKGNNDLAATAGADKANVTLIDHGINETLFAGPQQTPMGLRRQDVRSGGRHRRELRHPDGGQVFLQGQDGQLEAVRSGRRSSW